MQADGDTLDVVCPMAGPIGGGRASLDREVYLPEGWAVGFATKGELARAMLARAFAAGVPAAWVAGDEVYGNAGHLWAWLEGQGRGYVLAASCDHPVWAGGRQRRADACFWEALRCMKPPSGGDAYGCPILSGVRSRSPSR